MSPPPIVSVAHKLNPMWISHMIGVKIFSLGPDIPRHPQTSPGCK